MCTLMGEHAACVKSLMNVTKYLSSFFRLKACLLLDKYYLRLSRITNSHTAAHTIIKKVHSEKYVLCSITYFSTSVMLVLKPKLLCTQKICGIEAEVRMPGALALS